MNWKLLIWISFLVLPNFGSAQLIINEVCSSNDFVYIDEFDDSPDWIELYNSGTQPEQLSDYYITEDVDIPFDWQLPNLMLQPGEFFLILASGRGLENNRKHASFKVKRKGEAIYLFKNDKTLVDDILVPENETDWSYGRLELGQEWAFFSIPTPEEPNGTANHVRQTETPIFSVLNQFQEQSFTLEISSNTPNADIHFTLNGSEPTLDDPIYQGPIEIVNSSSVRAIAIAQNEVPSKVESNTYLIAESSTLPIIALSVDSLLFFDEETGMLVLGPDAEPDWPFWGANFWKDIELPVHFEYFTNDGELLTEFESGCKVHGGRGSRTKPQRSLRFTAKPIYGIDKIEYPFFTDKPAVNSFETIVLRNSSGDHNNTHFRDGFLSQYLLDEGVDIDAMSYQPTNVFLNGRYWGVMNIREKSDETYVAANYGIELDKLDVLEEDTLTIWGDRTIFSEDVFLVRNSDLSDDAVFEEVAERFDINSFADYIITETYLNNTDWGHNNLKLWRAKEPGAKWRYLFFDLDVSMRRWSWTAAEFEIFIQKMNEYTDEENDHIFTFKEMLKNETFRHYFVNRYCDLLNSTFRPEIFSEAIQNHADKLAPAVERQFGRWGCPGCSTFEDWNNTFIPQILEYSITKAPYSRQELRTFFGLENEVQLTLNVFPEGAGAIQINTVNPDELPWNGYYLNGVPVKLSVTPNAGFSFQNWESQNHNLNSRSLNLSFNFTEDDEITAIFQLNENITSSAFVFPNPADDMATVIFNLEENSEVRFDLFSVDGKLMKSIPSQFFEIGGNSIPLELNGLAAGQYFLRITSNNSVETVKVQR